MKLLKLQFCASCSLEFYKSARKKKETLDVGNAMAELGLDTGSSKNLFKIWESVVERLNHADLVVKMSDEERCKCSNSKVGLPKEMISICLKNVKSVATSVEDDYNNWHETGSKCLECKAEISRITRLTSLPSLLAIHVALTGKSIKITCDQEIKIKESKYKLRAGIIAREFDFIFYYGIDDKWTLWSNYLYTPCSSREIFSLDCREALLIYEKYEDIGGSSKTVDVRPLGRDESDETQYHGDVEPLDLDREESNDNQRSDELDLQRKENNDNQEVNEPPRVHRQRKDKVVQRKDKGKGVELDLQREENNDDQEVKEPPRVHRQRKDKVVQRKCKGKGVGHKHGGERDYIETEGGKRQRAVRRRNKNVKVVDQQDSNTEEEMYAQNDGNVGNQEEMQAPSGGDGGNHPRESTEEQQEMYAPTNGDFENHPRESTEEQQEMYAPSDGDFENHPRESTEEQQEDEQEAESDRQLWNHNILGITKMIASFNSYTTQHNQSPTPFFPGVKKLLHDVREDANKLEKFMEGTP